MRQLISRFADKLQMARHPRQVPKGTLQHVISRFVDREWRIKTQQDRCAYLQIISDLEDTVDWEFTAYALMSSHEHWAFIMGSSSFSSFFHRLHTRFSIGWQKRHRGIGPVYAGRPKNYTRAPKDMLSLVSYLHMNPVRAGVVPKASDSKWTSHRTYLRMDPVPSWINTERNLELMGFSDNDHGRYLFDAAVSDIESDRQKSLAATQVKTEKTIYRYADPNTVSLDVIQGAVEHHCQLPAKSLTLRTRLKQFTYARQIFIDIARQLQWSQVKIADHLCISRAAVSLLVRRGFAPPHDVATLEAILETLRLTQLEQRSNA